ncbi:hypothetical protein NQ318_002684, partial [Aromia moschata]
MQGNDVCNIFKETVGNMTKPEVFRKNVLETLNILNSKLPKNSNVILMGLVNADFIYDAMADRLHPIGTLHGNVRYKDLYNWFNCMQIGPCTGWLNSDRLLRETTTQRNINVPDLLEAVDSLHPNQRAQPMLTNVVWTSLLNLPENVLGPINKYNKINKIALWKSRRTLVYLHL